MNPFNICKGPSYQGLRAYQTDKRFCQFISMAHGCRAMWKLIDAYRCRFIEEKKDFTIYNIINRFAPPNENFTGHYIDMVWKNTDINPIAILGNPRDDKERFVKILMAMASFENGYSMDKVEKELKKPIIEGYKMAFSGGVI